MDFGYYLRRARDQAPPVHAITNVVTVNDCANIILAAGGAPTMASDIREVAEITACCSSLVLNLGSGTDGEAMQAAGEAANRLGHPVIFDPVAVGASRLRRDTAARLLDAVALAVIRGNASEIKELAGEQSDGCGVDVGRADVIDEENLQRNITMAKGLSQKTGAVIVVSGAIDLVVKDERVMVLRNGSPTMARITGSGCMLTAVIGAFCGASPDGPFEAAAAAVAAMGICGEVAEAARRARGTGTATFRTDLIDAMSNLTPEQLEGEVRYALYP